MNKILFVVMMLAFALGACSKKEVNSEEEKARYTEEMHQKDLETVGGLKISTLMKSTEYYYVRVLCVDGTSYVTYDKSITPHLSPETGKPIKCEVESK
jgi:uncharacterized protein YpmB